MDQESKPPVAENTYITTDANERSAKEEVAAKRVLIILIILIIAVVGLIAWEVIDHVLL